MTTTTVYAAQSNKTSISGLCTGTIANPTAGAGGWSYVYYGTYSGNAMKYRVLDKATTQFNTNTTMLLDCDSTIVNKRFDGSSKVWSSSEIKGWLNGNEFYGNTNVFTAREKAAIASSTKDPAAEGDGHGRAEIGYAQLTGEHVFLLDAVEATRQSYGYADQANAHDTRRKNGTSNYWWLRSPYSYSGSYAGYVFTSGLIYYDYVYYDYNGVSPAFNLNLSSVIFSSVISGTAGSAGAEYKLTIADGDLGITPGTVTRSGTTVTVPYTITGTNADNATQVSVLLLKNPYTAGTSVVNSGSGTGIPNYTYLKLNVDTWGTSGTGTFTLPAAYADEACGTDYYAYILAEDVNTGNATDYACTPVEITIPDGPDPGPKPTPKPKSKKADSDEHHEDVRPAAVNPDTVEGYFMVDGRIVPNVVMGKMKQGPAAVALFKASCPKGWTEAFTFNMAIDGKYEYTLKNGILTIIIPKEYRRAGRSFAIMGIDKNGKVVILNDTDTNPDTLTVNLNVEGYAFDLIYKD